MLNIFTTMRNEYYHFPTFNRLFYRAVHIGLICIFTSFSTILSAQVYSTASSNFSADQHATSQQYQSYQSTVYQPFESSVPSDNHPMYNNSQGDNNNRHNAPTNRRNLGGVEGDPGDQSDQSPVGEAWVMLFFAAVAALVVYIRNRHFHLEDTPKIP